MNRLLKIDNVMYRVSDLKQAEIFYRDVLGLKKVWEDADAKMIGFVFKESDSEIVIHSDSRLPEFDYSYLVENVDEFVKEVASKGCVVGFGPTDVRPGRYAVILDPDGNKIPVIDLTNFGGVARYDA